MPYVFVNPLLSTSMRENKLRVYGTIETSGWYTLPKNEYKFLELDGVLGKFIPSGSYHITEHADKLGLLECFKPYTSTLYSLLENSVVKLSKNYGSRSLAVKLQRHNRNKDCWTINKKDAVGLIEL